MSQLPWLEPDATNFPSTDLALDDPNGLLAAGSTLSTEQLVCAYRKGIFPWFEDGQPVLWWTPSPRLVLSPSQLHVSKSMKKLMRKNRYQVTTDKSFEAVIRACAEPREGQAGTWITDEIVEAYVELHELGFAHSIEVWEQDVLIGGLYGIAMGRVFFGESMFSRAANASKLGFITLAKHLDSLGFELIDCQVQTDHLESLGAYEIDRSEFEDKLLNYIEGSSTPPGWPTSLGTVY